MLWTPPNWTGLLLAAALFAFVLTVAPFATPRGQVSSFPHQVAACDRMIFCQTDFQNRAPTGRANPQLLVE
jgi:hypothetical protein